MGSPRRKLDNVGHDLAIAPNKTLRVLFDARKLGHGGIGSVVRTSLDSLALEDGVELSAIIDPGMRAELPIGIAAIEDATRDLSFDHLFRFAKRLELSRFDLLHVPHYFVPFGIDIPLVVTIHDTTHISHPEKFFYPLLARRLISHAANKAMRVITVSQASRDCLLRLGIPADKLRVIANAASFESTTGSRATRRGLLAVLSNLKPHKGLIDLLQAFQLAYEKHRDLTLSLAGFGFRDLNDPLVCRALQMPGVKVLGALSKQQLADCYASCAAVVIPSLTEGFGLMVTEAHAHATPVLARPVQALKEVLAPSDRVARDMSVAALTEMLCAFAESPPPPPSQEFIQTERQRLDPGTIARATLDVYREACA